MMAERKSNSSSPKSKRSYSRVSLRGDHSCVLPSVESRVHTLRDSHSDTSYSSSSSESVETIIRECDLSSLPTSSSTTSPGTSRAATRVIFSPPYATTSKVSPSTSRGERRPNRTGSSVESFEDRSSQVGPGPGSDEASPLFCRICQLTEKETGEPLHETGCQCRGSIRMYHVKCMVKWIQQRPPTNKCEICQQPYGFEVGFLPGALEDAPVVPVTPCDDTRRIWFVVIITLLMLATGASIALTVYSREDYYEALERTAKNISAIKPEVLSDYQSCYALSVAILVFSSAVGLGVWVIWIFSEIYLWPRERAMQRQWNVLNAAYREHATGRYTIFNHGGC